MTTYYIGKNTRGIASKSNFTFNFEEKKARKFILDYIQNERSINFTDIQKIMFPNDIYPDVFISHSHGDENLAKKLKEYLGVSAFIDSEIWGNIYNLEKNLIFDKPITYLGNETIQELNKIYSSTKLILATALSNVMHNSKYFVFIETLNSRNNDNTTYSPWIYFENQLARQIFIKERTNRIVANQEHKNESIECKFTTDYDFLDKKTNLLDIKQYIRL
ncbi:toll/interleukin-1 receptor domain-containing protein [Campylobacter sp. RM16190]|uniref:toll/interleukin-1 receptor domain-containing protein n=1 Tax=Campylobacter sp. RM16190 TaxID=1705727 RepID=UPI001474FE1F|nr:toll/interleukin-1 receptor domain-containing protein [Campylobacter sp. RM16190]